jgi:hypothetical protein
VGCSSRVSSNCDEIREEKTNKTLIVGLYRTKIIVILAANEGHAGKVFSFRVVKGSIPA